MKLNEKYEKFISQNGTDFVRFVDISSLPVESRGEYPRAVVFGRALSRKYIKTLINDESPERHEFGESENAMDALADSLAEKMSSDGYESVSELEYARLPHKTVARMAGFGFIGKSTLLVSEEYGCAAVLGKVLTTAPFATAYAHPKEPQCGDCNVCVDICPSKALTGKSWSITTRREEMLIRKLCSPCLKCLINCPYTVRHMEEC